MHETKVKRGGAMGDAKRNERAGIRVGGEGNAGRAHKSR